MTTREYEALIIFKAIGTEQEMTQRAAHAEDAVKKLGGHIATTQSFGRRKLAFRIARQAEGHYHLLRFQAPSEQIAALERIFRLNDAIVRFMILSEEELAPLQAAPAPVRAPV